MKKERDRLDLILVEKSLFPSREKARTSIMQGEVFVDNKKVDKPGTKVALGASIEVKSKKIPYVSRGGYKLEKALVDFNISLEGKIVMDIGASTGGFTDCMLQKGAKKIYAIDVGYGQLAWSLRQDPRVVNMERTNIRYLDKESISEGIYLATVDVSFISLKHVIPVLSRLSTEKNVLLIKPQFEVGKGQVGKGGVVRDPNLHEKVIKEVCFFAEEQGYFLQNLSYSPITGPKGNIEFIAYFSKESNKEKIEICEIVKEAHTRLNK